MFHQKDFSNVIQKKKDFSNYVGYYSTFGGGFRQLTGKEELEAIKKCPRNQFLGPRDIEQLSFWDTFQDSPLLSLVVQQNNHKYHNSKLNIFN